MANFWLQTNFCVTHKTSIVSQCYFAVIGLGLICYYFNTMDDDENENRFFTLSEGFMGWVGNISNPVSSFNMYGSYVTGNYIQQHYEEYVKYWARHTQKNLINLLKMFSLNIQSHFHTTSATKIFTY